MRPHAQCQVAALLAATSASFLASLFLLTGFDPSNPDFQFVEESEWMLGLTYKMGVDGISILFVMLTTFLMPLVIAVVLGRDTSRQRIHDRLPVAGNADVGRVLRA